jgi:NOL1/NOP2/fmu family ribosome biogenesis protein
MFRKGDTALDQWSRENVAACAVRQKQILDNSAKTVKDGGYLLYSTCTYSYEENELQVLEFLKEHPDYTLCPLKAEVAQAAAAGTVPEGTDTLGIDISLCARFYPHRSRGEGQFIALMRRSLAGSEPQVRYKDGAKPLSREEARIVQEFFKENLTRPPRGRLAKYGDNIVLISHGVPLPQRSVFSAGVLVGEIRGRMLFPSHQLFSAYGCDFSRKVELCDSLAERYIRGEEIEAPEGAPESGFAAITYKGAVIGGGKISAGRIKNHYPKGLRRTGGN